MWEKADGGRGHRRRLKNVFLVCYDISGVAKYVDAIFCDTAMARFDIMSAKLVKGRHYVYRTK